MLVFRVEGSTMPQPTRRTEAKIDFGILYNLQETVIEGCADWISSLHDHARISFTVGDSVWGNFLNQAQQLRVT